MGNNRSPRRSDNFLRGSYEFSCPLRAEAGGRPSLSTDDVEDNPDDDGGTPPEDEEGGEEEESALDDIDI